jgi:hypothetical protein
VDINFIPRELPDDLKEDGYVLKKDGTLLDEKGNPIVVFAQAQYFQIHPDKKSGLLPDEGGRQTAKQEAGKSGILPDIGNFFSTIFIVEAQAAHPHPVGCWSRRGWCEIKKFLGFIPVKFRAKTSVDAYGLDDSNRCSTRSPHTRVEYLETRAEIGDADDRDSCRNCDHQSSNARFHPFGKGWLGCLGGEHYAHLADSGIRATWQGSSCCD